MNDGKLPYDELRERLARAEALLESLRRGEVDMVIGTAEPLFVRYRSLVEENERLTHEWRKTFDSINDAVLVLDTGQRAFRANLAAEQIFHQTEKEMTGRQCWEIVHGTQEPIPECPFLRMRQSLRRERLELQVGDRWLEVTVDPVLDADNRLSGAVHIASDITKRREVEEALRESETRNRVIADLISDYAYIFSVSEQGQLKGEWVTESFTKVFGLTREEIDARGGWQTLVFPEDLPVALQHAQKVVAGETDTCEMRWMTASGEVRWIRDYAQPVFDSSGKQVVRIFGAAQDITEKTRSIQEQVRLQEQLQHAQKMESIGRLAGGVAHDFNNMLNIILGYGEIIQEKLLPGDPLREEVEEILKAGRRSAELTRQLLAFSRKQTLQPKVLDINEVIRSIEKMLHRLIGEDIKLDLLLSRDLPHVKVDPGQIEQVIMNLAVNARDAMPMGGKLLIETNEVELDETYAQNHPEVSPGKYIMLAISDTGCGMNKEILAQVFDPFFTTKEKGKGTGLGLATVYGIIKQSGGHIWAYSEPGQGATFKIYLPVTGDQPMASEGQIAQEYSFGGDEHILVVEDETALRGLLEAMLAKLGYKVTPAANGGEALLAVEEKGVKPDLVITDVVMPGMSGSVLVERLRRSQPNLKVLFMSGYTDNAIVHHGVLDHGTPFIQKPFALRDIAEKVRSVLRGQLPMKGDFLRKR